MSAPVSLSELHARHLIEGDPSATAEVIADVLRLGRTQREALFGLIVTYCENADRGRVRRIEAATVRRGVPVTRSDRARLLVETFPLPNGERVAWGAATVEQHEQRIGMLQRHVDGVLVTIDRHQLAIETIVAAGVTCLAEVEEVAA
jgi:hypothetical protein